MRVHLFLAGMLLALAGSASGQDTYPEPWDEEDGAPEDALSDSESPFIPNRADPRGPLPRTVSRVRWIRRSSSGSGQSILAGANLHMRTRIRASESVTVSVTTEKDPGERDPLDFVAGFAEIRFPREKGRMILGDFRPGYGQGLVCSRWSRGSIELDRVTTRSPEPVGYRSTYENGALRGFLLEGVRGSCKLAAFGSMARFDAVRDASGRVLRIDDGGIHVSATQRERVDALRESVVGIRVERFSADRWRGGLTAFRSGFNPPFLVQERGISGGSATAVGIDAALTTRILRVAGEIARIEGHQGWVAGSVYRGPRIQAGIQGRSYSSGFQSLHGSGPSTFGEAQNERGIGAGLFWNSRPASGSLIVDGSWHPGATSSLPEGSARFTVGLAARHRLFRDVSVRWSGRTRWDQIEKGKQLGVLPRRRQGLRMDAERRFRPGITVHVRGEANRTCIGEAVEHGGMVYGSIGVHWRLLRAEGRVTCFGIPSYENRMCEWEDTPEGMVGFRTLTGDGWKGYLMLSTELRGCRPTLKLWRQLPADGRKATTEFVFQLDVNR